MHRPNRIGDHHIADLSADDFVLDQTPTNFTTSLGTWTLPQVQTDTATLGDPISTVDFNTGDVQDAWVLAALKSWSFGRFISGAAVNEREVMIAWSINAAVRILANTRNVHLGLFAGMANATSVTVDKTAQVNLMDTMTMLAGPVNVESDEVITLNESGTFINSVFNGGASGAYDTNPLGIWMQATNLHASVNVTIGSVIGSLSIYRYTRDVDTFDPTR